MNVNQIDGAALGVEAGFSRVFVLDPGLQAWGCDSYSYLDSCLGCAVDALDVDLRCVSDSNRGRDRNPVYDRRPWALREEVEEAYPLLESLDSPVPFASYPPRDASICPSPSSPLPTSPSELASSPAPHPAPSLAQPSRRSASVYFLPAFRGRKPRPRRSLGVVSRAQRPYGPTPPVLRRPDRVCHGP